MKNTLLRWGGTCLLGLAFTLVALDQQATAQVDQTTPVVTENDDDDFEWGLLGLIGLLGLGGLLRGDRHHTTHRDTAAPAGTHTNRT